ncbi:MAG TPA: hypothetical protein VM658_01680 [bacterium]|nr:hypothetical protein [bacterium]
MRKNKFPSGWNEDRVSKVLAHYEEQSEIEAVAEDEAAFELPGHTLMEIPTDLVPLVQELITKHQS